MSKITLSSNASGTGTLTIASPNTSTNRTLTLPDETGTLLSSSGALNISSSAADDSLVIDASGNVGIGTSSPGGKLNVSGTSVFGALNSAYALQIGYNNTRAVVGQTYYIGATDSATPSLVFSDASAAERARIDSSGNLLVGQTSAGAANLIGTSIENSGLNNARITVNHSTTGSSNGSFYMQFAYGGTVAGTISQASTSTVAYNTSSDYRLKENIEPMVNALAKVIQLKPVTYTWKADGSDGQGFIAHELDEVVKGCVTGEKDAVDAEGKPQYQGIDTSFLVATLTAAIQEQQALIQSLTARITALETL